MITLQEVNKTQMEVSVLQLLHELESFDKVKDLLGKDVCFVGEDMMAECVFAPLYVNKHYQLAIKLLTKERDPDDEDEDEDVDKEFNVF